MKRFILFYFFLMVFLTSCFYKEDIIMVYNINNAEDVKKLFPKTPEEITNIVKESINSAKEDLQKIINLDESERNFKNTAKALDNVSNRLGIDATRIYALTMVYSDKEIRDIAQQEVLKLHAFSVDYISNNVDLYKAFKSYAEGNAKNEDLNEEEKYFIKESMKDFKKGGLELEEEKLKEVRTLKKDIVDLSLKFELNIAEDNGFITVDGDWLEGLSEEFINSLQKEEDKFVLGTDYPTLFEVMENCKNEQTRKELSFLSNNKGFPQNIEILNQIIKKRDQLARLLGFNSYAELDIDGEMAKNPKNVEQFLDELIRRGKIKYDQEFELLKKHLPEEVSLLDNDKFNPWDITYTKEQYKKKYLQLDTSKIKEYFPMEKTVDGILEIYAKFLKLKFRQLDNNGFWNKDVKLIEVSKDNNVISYLLLDLYPRDNKYKHACMDDIVPTVKISENKILPSVILVIANFPKSTANRPSLLKFDDVHTFFHEFGHAIHGMLGATEMASFSGTNVKRDFVEMPSQMFEEWLYDRDILKQLSSHYETGEALPDDIIHKLVEAKRFDSGAFLLAQSAYSKISLEYFAKGKDKEISQIFHDIFSSLVSHVEYPIDFHKEASFGHLTGYGAKYYGYMWSKVYALDLFSHIKKYGLLNPEIGQKYYEDVLSKGGSVDPNILLKNFLGREPKQDAFFKDLGL